MITKELTQDCLAQISDDVHGIKQVCNRQMLHTKTYNLLGYTYKMR